MRADVPFGRYRVPLVIDDELVEVSVVDGHGSRTVAREAPPSDVDVHPAFPTPGVRARQVEPTNP